MYNYGDNVNFFFLAADSEDPVKIEAQIEETLKKNSPSFSKKMIKQ